MSALSTLLLPLIACFALSVGGCKTVRYVEKNSEALSQTIYATSDSLQVARVDLAEKYAAQAVRLVTPPKDRIAVKPLHRAAAVSTQSTPKNPVAVNSGPNPRLLVLPDAYKSDLAIYIGSPEWLR